MLLGVAPAVVRHVGGWKAARVIGDAAEVAREKAKLRLPAAVVAGKLVDEEHGRAAARFLVIEPGAIPGGGVGHAFLLGAYHSGDETAHQRNDRGSARRARRAARARPRRAARARRERP